MQNELIITELRLVYVLHTIYAGTKSILGIRVLSLAGICAEINLQRALLQGRKLGSLLIHSLVSWDAPGNNYEKNGDFLE